MQGWLRYRWEYYRLKRSYRRTEKWFEAAIRKANKENKKREERRDLEQESYHELGIIDDEIKMLVSRRLISVANRYFLPTPDFLGDHWEECDFGRYLTNEAMKELRAEIRKERAEKRQDWQGALFWISGLTGIIGAITGLVAVLKK